MKGNSQDEVIEMEHQVEIKTQPPGTDNDTTSQTPITTTLSQNQSKKITPKRRVSFSFVTLQHSIVTSKELPYIPEEKKRNTSKQELSETVESLEMEEVVRADIGIADVDMDDVETGYRFSKSNNERKWSLASGFSIVSIVSKSSRSRTLSGSSNESNWSIGTSGDAECIINDLSLHSHFLYWPIPAFFLSIILLMAVFTVLAVIFS